MFCLVDGQFFSPAALILSILGFWSWFLPDRQAGKEARKEERHGKILDLLGDRMVVNVFVRGLQDDKSERLRGRRWTGDQG